MYRRWGLVRLLKLLRSRFIRLQGTPNEISRGVALGVAVGMTPTFGFQMILGAFCAWILKESKVAAVLGVWITNPVTAPIIYALEYETGRNMLNMDYVALPRELSFSALGGLGWQVTLPLCVGSIVWTVFGWLAAYYICLKLAPMAKRFRIRRWPRKPRY